AGVASPAQRDGPGEAGGGQHGAAKLAAARGGVTGAEQGSDLAQKGLHDRVDERRERRGETVGGCGGELGGDAVVIGVGGGRRARRGALEGELGGGRREVEQRAGAVDDVVEAASVG